MYHHRYQPQTSHPVNETNSAFARNNHYRNSPSASSTARDYHHQSARAPVGSVTDPSTASSSASSSATYQSNNSFVGHNRLGAKNQAYHSGAYFLQPKQFAEERQDVIFRRVRGILNKITPETFEKLSKELINVGLDSPRTLRGLIYLLFDKALKDLKYSSLYAKLCQELSERSPNFEKEAGPNTFCKFLISKCEDEFERRRKATEDFDNKNELTDEEFEQKAIAKQKMLGNIKFICELGKKRLLQEEILHECIRGLLSKKKERPLQDQTQDLECLCQIMRTIGSLLDIEASRNLMNQYFERIDMFSRKPDLPSRIRFMLRDVIDLRSNNWRPRPFQREDTVPQPLSKLREESGFGNASSNPPIDKLGNTKNLRNISDLAKLHGNKLSSMLLDDDGPSFTTTTDFHWGPTFLPHEVDFDPFSSGLTNSYTGDTLQKPIPIKVSGAVASTTVSRTQPAKQQAQPTAYLGQRFSQSDKPDHAVINQNHVDHLSKSHKASGTTRQGYGTREQALLDDDFVIKRNDPIANRSEASLAHDRKFFFREEPRHTQSRGPTNAPVRRLEDDRPAIAPPGRDALLNRHNRGNNDFVQGSQRVLATRNDYELDHDDRIPYGDSSRQLPHNRNISLELGIRNNLPINRQLDGTSPPRHHMPTHDAIVGLARVQLDQHQPDEIMKPIGHPRGPGVANDIPGHRGLDRRPERRDFEPPAPRQPKFSGANYRLPGRDRPLKAQPVVNRANQPPESEANLNWRSAEVVPPADTQAPKPRPPPQVYRVDLFDPSSKFADQAESIKPINPVDKQSIASEPKPIDSLPARAAMFQHPIPLPQRPIVPMSQVRTPSPVILEQRLHPRAENGRDSSRRPNSDFKQSPDHGLLNQHDRGNGPRVGARESGDHNHRRGNDERNDQQRLSPTIPAGNHERGDSKQARDTGEKFGGRSYRPAVIRNQSFDNANPEARRGPNWRKESGHGHGNNSGSTNNGNNQANHRRDNPASTVPAVVTPIVPKAPTPMSAADFTLRPSHNLIGRTLPDWATQPKPIEVVSQNKDLPIIENRQPSVPNSETTGASEKVVAETTCVRAQTTSDDSPKFPPNSQIVNKFSTIFVDGLRAVDTSRLAQRVKDLKVPKEDHALCIVAVLKHSIVRSEQDRMSTSKLLGLLIPTIIEPTALLDAFTMIFDQLHVLEVETPKVKTQVAEFLSRAVVDGLLSIEEVSQVLSGGKHHPLFLLFLQKLEKSAGQAWLVEKFNLSKVNLMDMLPEVDRTKERLISALKDRCLGFLDPMLTIEPDLWSQMRDRDASPAAVYRWIKENVDPSIQGTPTFAHVFIACLMRYIHGAVKERSKANNNNNIDQQKQDSDSSDSNKSSPTNSSSHGINDYEKELLSKYQQIMHALLEDKQMQLATLHALQSFYHGLDFPKGALLRWFHMMYDLSIVDDDVFFIWKEEINDEVPGKGQALFQVNTWLNWLAEAEDDEEEEDV